MKNNKWLIITALLLLVGIALFTVGFAGLDFDFSKLTTDDPYTQKQYDAQSVVSSVVIEDGNVDIVLCASQDDFAHVEYAENEKRLYAIELTQEGALKISKKENLGLIDHILNISFTKQQLRIALPNGFDGDVTLRNENGDVTVSDISAKNLDIHTVNQTTRISDVNLTGYLSVQAGNSAITLSQIRASDKVDVCLINGKLTLDAVSAKSLNAQANNTDTLLKAVSLDEGVQFSTANGSVTMDRLAFGGDLSGSTANGAIRGTIVGKLGDFSFACTTNNGSSNLPSRLDGGTKNVRLSTVNGDIDVSVAE